MRLIIIGFLFICFLLDSIAQEINNNDEIKVNNTYAPLRIKGMSPSKIISIAYEYNFANQLETNLDKDFLSKYSDSIVKLQNNTSLKLGFNLPIINKKNIFLGFGYNYSNVKFNFEDNLTDTFSLSIGTLHNHKFSFTFYKPLNAKHFILLQYLPEINSNFQTKNIPFQNYVKQSFVAAFGWYFHERKQLALGITRSYRAGEITYFPLIIFNYTSQNFKWGTEIALPARAHLKYNINTKNILMIGYELEGNSFLLTSKNGYYDKLQTKNNSIELRKSEYKLRIIAEKSLYKNIWFNAQLGYRLNNAFNIDEYDIKRFLNNKKNIAYISEKKLSNNFYIQLGVHFVAP